MIKIKISDRIWCWGRENNSDNYHSLSKYVELNDQSIRKKYLTFIYNLGQKKINNFSVVEHLEAVPNFSFWWMTTLAEKSLLKSPVIQDCLKIFALSEILRKESPADIDLYGVHDKDIRDSILIMCKNLSIKVHIHYENNRVKNIYNSKYKDWSFQKIPHIIKGTVWMIRYLYRHWPLRGSSTIHWSSSNKTVLFFSYFIHLNFKQKITNEFYSYQWGDLPNLFYKLGYSSNWMHHFLRSKDVASTKSGLDWLRRFNSNQGGNSVHRFIDGYLSFAVIFRSISIWIRLIVASFRLRNIDSLFLDKDEVVSLWPLLRNDWQRSTCGVVAFQNAILVELMRSAFEKMPKQNVGLYLYEGQSWEYAFIYFWKKYNHGKLIAVVHSVVRFWDLRYFHDQMEILDESLLGMPKPHKIATNGPIAQKEFMDQGYPRSFLLKTEAVRYLNFVNFSKSICTNNRPPRLLILGGGMPADSTEEMMEALNSKAQSISDRFSVSVKEHPDYSIAKESYSNLKIEIIDIPLYKALHKFDIVIGTHQSAAHLDAYLSGLPVVVYLPENDLNLSPLRMNLEVPVVSSANSLIKALEDCNVKNKRESGQYFWLDKNLPLWYSEIKNGF